MAFKYFAEKPDRRIPTFPCAISTEAEDAAVEECAESRGAMSKLIHTLTESHDIRRFWRQIIRIFPDRDIRRRRRGYGNNY